MIVESNGDYCYELLSKVNLFREFFSNGCQRKAVVDISVRPAKLIHMQVKGKSWLNGRFIKYQSCEVLKVLLRLQKSKSKKVGARDGARSQYVK